MALVSPQRVAHRSPTRRAAAGRLRRSDVRVPRLSTVLSGAGLALVPWMVVLAKTVPHMTEVSYWSTAWIGLDAMLVAGLAGTGALLRRGDPRVSAVAGATAALLVMDAWFDVTTSAGTSGQGMALALAAVAELPLAAVCAVVAVRRPA
ncbi:MULTISPECIES: hypothetical protein [unclassified Streptomyces]|uniref:hypothetical protein n=1 Tax=unclassified Streptomyces TaxID=2593676 RepID=UPI00226DF6AA|nr:MULTISPECIES: hypothetical protein [unclassified Streptomyces]MCY0922745.1 hypothetical protein [Streptomyces sp. H27-G5]MCY0957830.1 hypothetical protein [Streptomyces sp. H27-H5]